MTDTTTTEQRTTIADFVKSHHVKLTAERCGENPHMDDSANMDHWRVVLKVGRRTMTTYFSKGFGHNGKAPDAAEVLDCLASDASSVENASSLEDWCSDCGYDADSRKAERTYQTIERQSKALRRLLADDDAYDTLLFKTERE